MKEAVEASPRRVRKYLASRSKVNPLAGTLTAGSRSFALRIYVVAVTLRLVPVILARGLGIGLDDMFQYDMLARSIVSGNGYRWYARPDLDLLAAYVNFDLKSARSYDPERGIETSFRAPLYPAFLAGVYWLAGTDASRFFSARLAQAIFLGAPLAPLTYLTARRVLSASAASDEARAEQSAQVAAWVIAGYPMLLLYPLGLGTENLFFALLLAAFLMLLRTLDKRSIFGPLACGVLLALTALTRSVMLPFAALAIVWLWFFVSGRASVLAALSMLIVACPWVARNSRLHGRLTGVESSMGYNLYLGYHPQGDGSFVFGPSLDLLSILDDSARDRIGTQRALEFIQHKPQRVLPLAANRLAFFFGLEKRVLMYFYSNDLVGYIPPPFLLTILLVVLLPFALLSMCASLGFAVFSRSSAVTALLLMLFIGYLLPHVLILSEDRFHLALVPYLAIFAARFWTGGWRAILLRWGESRTGRLAVALGVCACVLLIINWGGELRRDAGKLAALLGPQGNQMHYPY